MKLKDGFILREVAGEYVVLPAGEDLNLNMMITLNESGCFLWKKLEEGAQEEELVQAVLEQYDADPETVAEKVAAFVEKLRANDFLEE